MAASNFKASLAAVLKSEGSNDDDPADHGGRTSRGITQREYTAWLAEQHRPDADVWKAPQADIEAIYHDEYWNPWCDLLPVGLDYTYFNNNVLDGPYRSTVLLQQALGVTADGRVGPITRQAMTKANARDTIEKLAMSSRAFYLGLHQPRFTKGWLNRVEFVRETAISMVKPV